jgi:hypothetical protein
MRNHEVVKTWIQGKNAKNGTGCFSTDGNHLFSYELCIGKQDSEGKRVVYDYREERKISTTTLKHVNYALRYGGGQVDLISPPEDSEPITPVKTVNESIPAPVE